MIAVTPGNNVQYDEFKFKVFLAGTIDNGDSTNWQKEVIDKLDEDLVIFNPRRDNWKKDATQQDLEEQIKWEQEHLEEADLIIMYLADNSKSPISLLELGLYGKNNKMIVFCTDNFYRYTNIRLTCERYNILLMNTNDIEGVIESIKIIYNKYYKK